MNTMGGGAPGLSSHISGFTQIMLNPVTLTTTMMMTTVYPIRHVTQIISHVKKKKKYSLY